MKIEGELRKEIVDSGRELYQLRLMTGTGGNISGRIDDKAIIITPSGVCKGKMKAYDLIRMLIETGEVTAGGKPSMETPFHLAFYRQRKDVGAVIHSHPLFCTLLSVTGESVRTDLTPEGLMVLKEVAFIPYATPGSDQLAKNLAAGMNGHDAFILENHGAITVGKDIADACHKMETLEFLAELQVRARGNDHLKGLSTEEKGRILGLMSNGK
jgi:L-fuculose-phosphate aldolase